MLIVININQEDLINAFWFAVASATQTYRRMVKSKGNNIFHIYRIFIGKIGELTFLRWLSEEQKILSLNELNNHIQQSLSIFWGEYNVDNYDIIIKNKKIDVKTVPNDKYQWLIVPIDQWENQVKDYYVVIATNISKEIITVVCNQLKICSSKEDIQDILNSTIQDMQVIVKGYLPRGSPKWQKIESVDKYCPEKECVRAKLQGLESIGSLLVFLRK